MNVYKAIFMIDVLIAIIPLLFIIMSALQIINLQMNAIKNIEEDRTVKSLFLISEYIVKTKAVIENERRIINKIDDSSLDIDIELLKENANLKSLYIGFSPVEDEICIYRYVLYSPSNEIKRLFICGS